MKNGRLSDFMRRDGTRTVLSSIVSILIGLVVGAIVVFVVGLTSDNLTLTSAWEGIRLIFGGLQPLGIVLDEKRNSERGGERIISTDDSDVVILIIPTNEEYMIARDTYELVHQ